MNNTNLFRLCHNCDSIVSVLSFWQDRILESHFNVYINLILTLLFENLLHVLNLILGQWGLCSRQDRIFTISDVLSAWYSYSPLWVDCCALSPEPILYLRYPCGQWLHMTWFPRLLDSKCTSTTIIYAITPHVTLPNKSNSCQWGTMKLSLMLVFTKIY